jgi:hypothetical protein
MGWGRGGRTSNIERPTSNIEWGKEEAENVESNGGKKRGRTSNIERPTSNTEWKRNRENIEWGREGRQLSCVPPGGADAGYENAYELVAFVDEWVDSVGGFDEWDALDESEPAVGLTQFLQADVEFVDEVLCRFCGLGLAMVGIGRCACTKELAGNVVRSARVGELPGQTNDPRAEFQQTIFQIISGPLGTSVARFP